VNARPGGAPLVDWTQRRDWISAARDAGRYDALAAHFAPMIAREARRFAQDEDLLLLVAPSIGGYSTLAAAPLLREAGLRPRIATDRRFLFPTADGPELDEWRRDRVLRFGEVLRESREQVEVLEESIADPLLIDASFTPLVPFGTPWRHEVEWADHWRWLVNSAAVRIAVETVPFANPNGDGMFQIDDHPAYTATIALGALSEQNVMLPAAPLCGHILLAPAHPPIESRWRVIGRPRIDPPEPGAHKYSRGMVVVVGGEMPGAARLAARAAAASGAGYVVLAAREPDAGADAIVHRTVRTADELAALLQDKRVGAVVIGPGLGRTETARSWLDAALASDRPLVLDADALTLMGTDSEFALRREPVSWVTPHYAEWEALVGEGVSEYGKLCRTAWWAEEGAGIIFKGADTVIGTPVGAGVLDRLAPSWLSTAGTGDVLSGILAARLAVRKGDWDCGYEAAWLHMRAAELAGPAFTADALIEHIPAAIGECG
jgi:hydroxyethylthiazole kinase-like uncharacterized protein yjeF